MKIIQRNSSDKVVLKQIQNGQIQININKGLILSCKKDIIGNTQFIGYKTKLGDILFTFMNNNKATQFYVCRAIWLAKYGCINENKIVSHKDNNKNNNSISNLYLKDIKPHTNIKSFTENDIQWLKENRLNKSLPELARYLNRSIKSVRQKIKHLSLSPKGRKPHYWTDNEDILLQQLYGQKFSVKQIALQLKRSMSSVRLRANRKFNLFRSDKHLRSSLHKSKNFYLTIKHSITKGSTKAKCCLCEYSKYIQLHHIDNNNKNNNISNIASLCPNHHVEITHGEHRDKKLYCIWWRIYSDNAISEIFDNLKEINSKLVYNEIQELEHIKE